MSGNQHNHSATTTSSYANRTSALSTAGLEVKSALHEIKVFNITITSLALCVLACTGLYCIVICHKRRRQSKRAHMYESAVTCEEPVNPVAVKAVKRSTSFRNPLAFFRKQECPTDHSRIYYIYSNPLPIGLEEEETSTLCRPEDQPAILQEISFQDYAMDPNTGIVLDPPIFYMQL